MKKIVHLRLKDFPTKRNGWWIVLDDDQITPLYKFAILEPPWRGNANGHGDYRKSSCIPAGLYKAHFAFDPKKGFVLIIEAVPDRSDVWAHRGFDEKDTEGCQLFGLNFNDEGNLVDSRKAQDKLAAMFKVGEKVLLRIIDAA